MIVNVGNSERLGWVTWMTQTRLRVKIEGLVNTREFHRGDGIRYAAGDQVDSAGELFRSYIARVASPADIAKFKREKKNEQARDRRENQKQSAQNKLLGELKDAVAPLGKCADASFSTTSSGNGERITGYEASFTFKTRAEFDKFAARMRAVMTGMA